MNHESLYKNTNAISRAQLQNRVKNINMERTLKRSNIHFERRNIEEILSPASSKEIKNDKNVLISEKKENLLAKLNKQLEYAKKFNAWKAEKRLREAEKKKVEIKKPFYSAVSTNGLKHIKEVKNIAPSIKGKTVTAEKKKIIAPKPIKRFAVPSVAPLNIAVVNPLKQGSNLKENKANNFNKNNNNKTTKLLKPEKVKNKSPPEAGKPNVNVLKEKHNYNKNVPKMNVKTMKKCVNESNVPVDIGNIPVGFLVSTARKASRGDRFFPKEDDTISPIEVLSSPNNENEASVRKRKRSHLKVNEKDNDNKIKPSFGNKKFDFHHIPKTSLKVENQADPVVEAVGKTTPNSKNNFIDLCTPLKLESDNRNEKNNTCNYLSPFVRLSRGKGSAKKEKEKRESFYKLETNCKTSEETVRDRQTRESVKYFRKMLQDETQRLKKLCTLWEDYKDDNKELLEENGEDMINASIGQTKLLLRKKFQQFDDLINRCENCIGVNETDNCNKEQRVYSDDLEGFWEIVKYQVDNIDARFDNLNKWKANDWNDPQEIKVIEKKVSHLPPTSKPKKHKVKSRAHNALLEVLRKTQAAYKKNKQLNPNVDNDVIFMPEKGANTPNKNHKNSPILDAKPNFITNLNTQLSNTNAEDIELGTTNNLLHISNQSHLEDISEKPTKKRCSTPLIHLENTEIKGDSMQVLTNNSPFGSKGKTEKRGASISSDLINFVTPLNTPRKSVRLSVMKNYTEEAGLTPHRLMSSWIRKNCVSCSPKSSNSAIKSRRLNSPKARKSILKTPGSVKTRHRSVLFSNHVEMRSPSSASGSETSFNDRHSIRLRNRRVIKREITGTEIP